MIIETVMIESRVVLVRSRRVVTARERGSLYYQLWFLGLFSTTTNCVPSSPRPRGAQTYPGVRFGSRVRSI